MEVTIEYFAAARELCGVRSERVPLPADAADVRALLALLAGRHERLAPVIHRMRVAINGELAGEADAVRAGDEVAVLPPVAGGSTTPPRSNTGELPCGLRAEPLSVDEVLAALRAPDVGGIALFIGTVRDHAAGKRVVRLDYEAHETMAARELRSILDELEAEQPGVRLCAVHRVGELAIGELAVIVGASAPHRAAAFSACREAIERIKQRVPIWKKEWSDAGDGTWVNLDG